MKELVIILKNLTFGVFGIILMAVMFYTIKEHATIDDIDAFKILAYIIWDMFIGCKIADELLKLDK